MLFITKWTVIDRTHYLDITLSCILHNIATLQGPDPLSVMHFFRVQRMLHYHYQY